MVSGTKDNTGDLGPAFIAATRVMAKSIMVLNYIFEMRSGVPNKGLSTFFLNLFRNFFYLTINIGVLKREEDALIIDGNLVDISRTVEIRPNRLIFITQTFISALHRPFSL